MKVVVFLADGFEECEALIVVDILRRARVETITASITGRMEVYSSRNICIKADALIENVDFSDVNMIVLPGGRIGTDNLAKNDIVLQKCREFSENRIVAAICAAPSILANLGLLDGKNATCHPDYETKMAGAVLTGEDVVSSRNIITARGLGAAFQFAFELLCRLLGKDSQEQIMHMICYEKVGEEKGDV